MKRANHRIHTLVTCIAVASLCIGGSATAQFPSAIELPPDLPTVMPAPVSGYPPTVAPTAAAPYFATPAWSQTLAPNVRFVILSNFSNDAVLDRETGLVWSRRTVATAVTTTNASGACRGLVIGNRAGWRLPAMNELQSLLDFSVPATSEPRLPAGHPFALSSQVELHLYWASETLSLTNSVVRLRVQMDTGATGIALQDRSGVLCVRGSEVHSHLDTL